MWPWYNTSFVPAAFLPLPCLATCFSLLLSSVFLPPWLRVGMGWHLYLDTANSLLGDQNQPLIQGRVEVAFPLLG